MPASITMFGVFALLGGSVGYFALPYGISASIKSLMNLAENGTLFSRYVSPRGVFGPSYHLFAIKNPQSFLNGGRPTFELKGPYVFTSSIKRDNIQFNEDGQKVAFETRRTFTVDELHSADLDEQMWLINPIMIAVTQMTKSRLIERVPFGRLAESVVLSGLGAVLDSFDEQPIIQTTPRKMLVGRRVKILDMISSIGANQYAGLGVLPSNIFGLVPSNAGESIEMWTGVGKTRDKFADVAKFKGKNQLTIWRDKKCNAISGTNGELYKPFPKRGKSMRAFIGKMCRTVELDPTSDKLVATQNGAMALEYELSKRSFQGARRNPENECFCDDMRTYDCQYDGLLELGPCYYGAPVYMAQVNFKDVDPRIRDLVNWRSALYYNDTSRSLRGERKQLSDKQVLRVDPITGLVLECELSIMALLKVVRNPRMRHLAKIQPLTYMPLFVLSESIKFPKEAVWLLVALQKISEYQGMAMVGAALTGAGTLLASSLLL